MSDPAPVKETLLRDLGVKVVVDKVCRTYPKDYVRVHVGDVRGLRAFVEIEAVGRAKDFETLQKEAEGLAATLGWLRPELIRDSCRDLLPRARKGGTWPFQLDQASCGG